MCKQKGSCKIVKVWLYKSVNIILGSILQMHLKMWKLIGVTHLLCYMAAHLISHLCPASLCRLWD